ncbi:hypothetical protein O1Q96_00175 (plasmid) [Streptomyces sp. Qhu-G9]|uniref:hypothetical protein n=1 Tax=Streptomyces sp. Qhu-G9 TaxID=3452799 RepID=UPI0022AC5CD6|nr:hypothetical protein [Streptomyces aurantiacus]WAU78302.1 hypothetical protein O1Q96_00175 [Streptomyces aurantiacus]
MFTCFSFRPAAAEASASPGLGQAAESLLMAAMPEFLGALGAGLVIAIVTTAWRRLRHRTSTPDESRPGPGRPGHHPAYIQSWRDAHELSQEYATAVRAGNTDEARRCLDALMTVADQWKSHSDFPAATNAVRAAHDADLIPER